MFDIGTVHIPIHVSLTIIHNACSCSASLRWIRVVAAEPHAWRKHNRKQVSKWTNTEYELGANKTWLGIGAFGNDNKQFVVKIILIMLLI